MVRENYTLPTENLGYLFIILFGWRNCLFKS